MLTLSQASVTACIVPLDSSPLPQPSCPVLFFQHAAISLFSAAALDALCPVAAAVAAVPSVVPGPVFSGLLDSLFGFASVASRSSTRLLCCRQQSSFHVSVGLQFCGHALEAL